MSRRRRGRGSAKAPQVAGPATATTRCAKCVKAFTTGESIKSEGGRFYHLACFYMRTSKGNKRRIRQQVEEKRADRNSRADAATEEATRSHKPSDWRLGKSPSNYGR